MAYDATKMADWQIAEEAERNMPTPEEWRDKLGLEKDEIMAYGRISKLDFLKIINRLGKKPDGKYIEVTAITPTPLGEGKTTTAMGSISATTGAPPGIGSSRSTMDPMLTYHGRLTLTPKPGQPGWRSTTGF